MIDIIIKQYNRKLLIYLSLLGIIGTIMLYSASWYESFLSTNGYTEMFYKIIDHKNIEVKLNTPFKKEMEEKFFHSFLSIPIDEYFDFKYGKLPYRSILFEDKFED